MRDHTKLGIGLLVPPVVLWFFTLLFFFDQKLGIYVLDRISPTSQNMILFIAGLIFPSAAILVGVSGILEERDKNVNIAIVVTGCIMLTMIFIKILR